MSRDPYKYFRVEARELVEGLTQGVLALEKGAPAPDLVARLLRMAHTLKGAARVVKQASIAEQAHGLEALLAGVRTAALPLPAERASELLRLLDAIGLLVSALQPAGGAAPAPRPDAPADAPLETVRVEIGDLDALLRGVLDTSVRVAGVRRDLGALVQLRGLARLLAEQLGARPGEAGQAGGIARARALAEDLRAELDRLGRELEINVERAAAGLAEVQDLAHRLRLVPARTVFPSLDRTVRDAAQALGKSVDFEARGGEVQLDANVLAALGDALMHAVRNAVVHGIEAETERVAAGKPARGQVRLTVERHAGRVAFTCQDDGRGVELEAVRAAAIARGLVTSAEAAGLSAEGLLALVQAGGLTTSARASELSGRGIGLDVVQSTAARLKGDFQLRSAPGRGTTLEVEVPVSIASLQGLVVEAAGCAVVLPLDCVRRTLRLDEAQIARSAGGQSILHEGKVIPFVPLDRALRRPGPAARSRRIWSAVLLQAGDAGVAVGVDRLLGTSSVVVRPLPAMLDADPVVAGASLDPAGIPRLVLDPAGLAAAAARGAGLAAEAAPPGPPPILIVDDSLTTRMLEQSILESAGYAVELAVSAEDGLAKARAGRHSLFIVDVEMPGMDGFEFVAAARADAALREVPSILVTSRGAAEDRRRGEQVGARAYIVKGEFDQGSFLQTIRRLVG